MSRRRQVQHGGFCRPEVAAFLRHHQGQRVDLGAGYAIEVWRRYFIGFDVPAGTPYRCARSFQLYEQRVAKCIWQCAPHGATERRHEQALMARLSNRAQRWAAEQQQAAPQPSSGEARPKDTDQVAAVSETPGDGQLHGGDGASGEVPDSPARGGAPCAAATLRDPANAVEEGGASCAPAQLPSHPGCGLDSAALAAPGQAEHANAPDQPPTQAAGSDARSVDGATVESPDACGASQHAEMHEPTQPATAAAAVGTDGHAVELPPPPDAETVPVPSVGGSEEGEPARAAEVRNALRAARHLARQAAAPSTAAREQHGGVYGTLRGVPIDRAILARARRALSRLVHDGEDAAGPRWDSRRIAVRTAGYLQPWRVDDRRLEAGRPALLILPDVSGSMSAFASEVCRLAVALGALPGADVLVVAHSNGYPEEALRNGRPVRVDQLFGPRARQSNEELVPQYRQLIARYGVRAVVAAADWDASWLYRALVEPARGYRPVQLYWLDVWSSSNIGRRVVPFPPRYNPADWPVDACRRVRYAFGCASAEDAVRALEAMC